MAKKIWQSPAVIAGILAMFLILGVSALATQAASTSVLPLAETAGQTTTNDDPLLSAIIVVRAASGKSYMADRDSILKMPELKTIEEMKAFIKQYEPAKADQDAVRIYWEGQGLQIVAQDNLFLIVSGTRNKFSEALGSSRFFAPAAANLPLQTRRIIQSQELPTSRNDAFKLIDGLIIAPLVEAQPTPASPTKSSDALKQELNPKPFLEPGCSSASKSIDDVVHAFGADSVHDQGITGNGVRIGFIDEGLYTGHPFFYKGKLNTKLYRYVYGKPTQVGINFEPITHTGHGTMVAAYLSAIAPDAQLLSFAKPAYSWEQAPYTATIGYLTYMHQYQMVDILSLSIGPAEEAGDIYVPETRVQMINLMTDGVAVLVSAGNTGQNGSGHNVLAAIPEVIAVGGADLDYTAAGGYISVTGAASFTSTVFLGRQVPDVVGFFGPDICFPFFDSDDTNINGYWHYSSGTSGAAPQIAGIVALLKQKFPYLNQPQVRSILQANAFDIVTGQSGDGDPAGPGYDLATGYGLPIADWVLDDKSYLYKGWNLIGLTRQRTDNYTALKMLQEIQTQGGSCTNVTQWVADKQKYEGLILDNGQVYGFDFPISLGVGYWVYCSDTTLLWRHSVATSPVVTPQPIQFLTGWNAFSIPYSAAPCTAEKLIITGTNNICDKVLVFDGQTRLFRNMFGNNFPLNPGTGYFARCRSAVSWTPVCDNGPTSINDLTQSVPRNYYVPSSASNVPAAEALAATPTTRSVLSADVAQCTPQNVRSSNISDQQFSVSWTTTDPCPGSVVIHNGIVPVFQAFDDRNLRFSGTTHHITIRGLSANTTYSFGLLSGDVWDNHSGAYYQVRTGSSLATPGMNYDVHGQVADRSSSAVQDAIVYVQLENRNAVPITQSTLLSFPSDRSTQGYAINLDNARATDAGAYFNYLAGTHLKTESQGGSAGYKSNVLALNLAATPSITAAQLIFDKAVPRQPILSIPQTTTVAIQPTFRFSSTGTSGQVLTYRLELSVNNFATIDRVYDQRVSTTGWSAASYSSGQVAQFIIPTPLQELVGYQWRVFAYNSEAWSSASDIAAFSITRYFNVFLPVLLRNASGGVTPNPTPGPTATPFPTPTPLPVIPTPASAPVTNLQIRIRFDGRSITGTATSGHNVPTSVIIRDLMSGTVRYSGVDLPVIPGTTPDTDWGTITLSSLAGHNIYAGRPYEILVTGKMYLTRKWVVSFAQSGSVVDLTGEMLWGGDFNGDNRIDTADYNLFYEQYSQCFVNTPDFCYPVPQDPNSILYKCDLDGDLRIKSGDYAIFYNGRIHSPGD